MGEPSGWINRTVVQAIDDAGAVLRAWRAANGRNQAEVAAILGMTQQNLSQIENGRQTMTFDLRRVAVQKLGISAADLGLADPGRTAGEHLDPAVATDQARWRMERRWLNEHRGELARLAVDLYPAEYRVGDTPLIAGPGWITDEPVNLRTVRMTLDESPQRAVVNGSEDENAPQRPLCKPDQRYDRYTSAIRHIDPPRLFESRPSYRLLDCRSAAGDLGFGLSAYFDKLDLTESVAHELAAACMTSGIPCSAREVRDRLPFRNLIDDPFDLHRRAVVPAIETLTIRLRRHPADPTFLLHWRDPAKVATAGGIYGLIPAGEFQPASVALWDRQNDFDLWKNVVREFSEELLGAPEHDGTRSEPIDYDNWPLYANLEDAQDRGCVVPYFLGVGLDALTLAATILTVVVIDDDVFEDVFGDAVSLNEEGEIVGIGDGRSAEGLPFDAETVHRLLTSEPMASPGAACLARAWQYRDQILSL